MITRETQAVWNALTAWVPSNVHTGIGNCKNEHEPDTPTQALPGKAAAKAGPPILQQGIGCVKCSKANFRITRKVSKMKVFISRVFHLLSTVPGSLLGNQPKHNFKMRNTTATFLQHSYCLEIQTLFGLVRCKAAVHTRIHMQKKVRK